MWATANTDSLVSGNDLFLQGCPLHSMQNKEKIAPNPAAVSYLELFHTECQINFETSVEKAIYRRSDDPANQNL